MTQTHQAETAALRRFAEQCAALGAARARYAAALDARNIVAWQQAMNDESEAFRAACEAAVGAGLPVSVVYDLPGLYVGDEAERIAESDRVTANGGRPR